MLIVAAAVAVLPHEVVDIERRLAEELGRALILEDQQLALHGAHRRRRHIAVARHNPLGAFLGRFLVFVLAGGRDVGQHLAQVLEIDEALVLRVGLAELVVGIAEHDVENAFLHIVEVEDAREKQRPDLEHAGTDGMALLAEQIPEHDRKLVGLVFEAELLGALDEGLLALAGRADAGQVALDVGGEHRHAGAGEAFGQRLQGHRLAGAGGAGDETVAVAEGEGEHLRLIALADENLAVRIGIRHQVLLRPRRQRRNFANAASIIGPRRMVGERFGTTVTMWRLRPGNASPFVESKAVSPIERDQFVSASPRPCVAPEGLHANGLPVARAL